MDDRIPKDNSVNSLNDVQSALLGDIMIDAFDGSIDLFNSFLDKNQFREVRFEVKDNAPKVYFRDVANKARAAGKANALIEALKGARPDNSYVSAIDFHLYATSDSIEGNFRSMLDRRVVSTLDGRSSVFGGPRGKASNEIVGPAIARLQKTVRGGTKLEPINWTNALLKTAARTCQISIALKHGSEELGSGFLIGPDMIITNFHVVESILKGEVDSRAAKFQFDYAVQQNGSVLPKSSLLADRGWHVADSPYSDSDVTNQTSPPGADELDYAVMKLNQNVGKADNRGWFSLKEIADLDDDEVVFILQYPNGEPLKLSIGLAMGRNDLGNRLHYDADTLGGASGAPVLNQNLRLTAMHHACSPEDSDFDDYNQGIPMQCIVQDLIAKDKLNLIDG